MPSFTSVDGTEIHYRDVGEGPPVVLLHGLTADGEMNWEWTGLAPAIRAAGFRTLVPDARGHGRSGKPHDPPAYADERFVSDVAAMLDHAGVGAISLVGYSMGGAVAMRVAVAEPRVAALVLAGVDGSENDATVREEVARGMETSDLDGIAHPEARTLREFADATGADRQALAALQRGRSPKPFELDRIAVPTLVLAGAADDLAPRARQLAARIGGARFVEVPGDHASVLIEPAFRDTLVGFIADHRIDRPGEPAEG